MICRLPSPAPATLAEQGDDSSSSWFWPVQIVGWTAAAAGVWLASALGVFPIAPPGGIVVIPFVVGFLVTSAVRPLCRRIFDRHYGPLKLVPILIGLAGGLSIVANVILRGMILLVNPESLLERYSQYVGLAYALRFLWMLVWLTLYFVIKQWQHTRVLDRLHAAAELKLLRQQVNPHFLLNALNSIVAQAHDPGKVTLGIESLADYLRFSLRQTRKIHPLRDELQAMEDYLTVEKIRFEETLQTSIAAEPAVREMMVPPAIIQPLVENALQYGAQESGSGTLCITITARISGDTLLVAVENSGPWVDSPQRPKSRSQLHGTGLANLRRRLEVIYGGRAGMDIEHDPERVRVIVRIPVEKTA
jgi:hypothetical protein